MYVDACIGITVRVTVCVSMFAVIANLWFLSLPVIRSSRQEKIMRIYKKTPRTMSFSSLKSYVKKYCHCKCFFLNFQIFGKTPAKGYFWNRCVKPGPFLRPTMSWCALNSQWVWNSIFPTWKHICPISWKNS